MPMLVSSQKYELHAREGSSSNWMNQTKKCITKYLLSRRVRVRFQDLEVLFKYRGKLIFWLHSPLGSGAVGYQVCWDSVIQFANVAFRVVREEKYWQIPSICLLYYDKCMIDKFEKRISCVIMLFDKVTRHRFTIYWAFFKTRLVLLNNCLKL